MPQGELLSIRLGVQEGRGIVSCILAPGSLGKFLEFCDVPSLPKLTDVHMRGLCSSSLHRIRTCLTRDDPMRRTQQEREEWYALYDTEKTHVDFEVLMTAPEACPTPDCLHLGETLLRLTLEPRTLNFDSTLDEG
ncbi:MAG TPA: hypothetical protein VF733_00910 [Candidatus Saccharimonadales bacterium]